MTQPAAPTNHRPSRILRRIVLLSLLALACGAGAEVVSKTVYFLQPDGRSYLLERSLQTDASSHRFFVDKGISQDDLRHVEPKDFAWDDSSRDDLNILTFQAGGFTVIFPGTLAAPQLEEKAGGEFSYRSWDGRRNDDGRFGVWYSPDDFDRFSYTWIFPDNIELLSYTSNRDGDWIRRGNAVSFFASRVNNLTFELRYRVAPVDRPPKALKKSADCPPPETIEVPAACPEPPAVLAGEPGGCGLDCDGDGVINRLDACPDTRGGVVDRRGCPVSDAGDSDGDGVNDEQDLCPGSREGARVDRAGCSLDTDKDGVPDGVDRCLATPEDTAVDASGCRS